MKNVWILIVMILYGLALYFLPLQSTTFYFDDRFSIENNQAIKAIDIPRIFNAFNTRFLVGLSFALNYQWSGLHPAGYRLANILIHCLNAFLVYLLIRSILCCHPERSEGSKGTLRFFTSLRMTNNIEWPAFFGSMLFLCHPIQTEPVNFITQRFVLMGSFFYLLTLYLYIQYRARSEKRYLIAAIGSATAAMFCKEFVVTLPLMLALYESYFLHNGTIWKRCKSLLPFFAIVLIVPLLLFRTPAQTVAVANIADSDLNHIDITRAHNGIGRQQYFLTELNVVCTYVRLLFLPVHQNLDYDYPLAHGIGPKTALCGAFLLGLLAVAVITYRSYRLISFGILWFFIALSVESSFIPIGDVITEYRLYLPSVGFVFLVMNLIYARRMDVKQLNMIAVVILIAFSILTFQRNRVWKDEITLWSDTVQKSPHSARPYTSRGTVYYQRGDSTQAMSDYNKAIEINPNYLMAYYNRGLAYYNQGKLTQAISDFTKAIALNPKFAVAYNNRGNFYDDQNNLTKAISDYTEAIKIIPNYAEAYNNRGTTYGKRGNLSQAISDFTKAIELNPKFAEAYNNRGDTYDNQGNLNQAISDFTKAIGLNPELAEVYDKRGTAYGRQGNFNQAISDFTKAIELNPKFAKLYFKRGIVHYDQGNLPQSISDYTKAIELNPKFAEAYNNRGNTYDDQGHLSQGISDYTKAIELNPAYADAYDNRGIDYFNENNLPQAISDFAQAIKINPSFAEAYNNRGFAYFKMKEYAKAWADVHEAKELNYAVSPALISALTQASGNPS